MESEDFVLMFIVMRGFHYMAVRSHGVRTDRSALACLLVQVRS